MSFAGSGFEAAVALALSHLPEFDEEGLRRFLKPLPGPVKRFVFELWRWQAHGGQEEPPGDWRQWLLQAGRGFGKTRAGAEWVHARARKAPGAAIALVGASIDDAIRVMVEGPSGLIATARSSEPVEWVSSRKALTFASGARGFLYSGEKPSRLRGPEHHFAWCDELAKWARPDETWDMLRLGLRLGATPQAVVTTTPRPIALVKRIVGLERTVVTRGRTIENVHISADFIDAVSATYAGTRLGRQELDGEFIEDVEGALWTRALVEGARVAAVPEDCELVRVVIGVDPPASAGGDECGIVAVGLGEDGIGYVLGDHSVGGLSPEGWARRVAAAAEAWQADRVVVETNNGGEMVEAVLRGASIGLPVRPVNASRGKSARAEPVAVLFENGRAKLAGRFPELEDQLCGLTIGGGYEGPGRSASHRSPASTGSRSGSHRSPASTGSRSPDRADAMVWALTELMLGPPARLPRITRL